MTKLHHLYLFNSSHASKRVKEADLEILVLGKRTWAQDKFGKRYLLGSTAFYTLEAANRAKRGALQKIIQTPFLGRNPQTMSLFHRAQEQLARFEATGEFIPSGRRKLN